MKTLFYKQNVEQIAKELAWNTLSKHKQEKLLKEASLEANKRLETLNMDPVLSGIFGEAEKLFDSILKGIKPKSNDTDIKK